MDSTLASTIPKNLLFLVQGLIKIFNFEIIKILAPLPGIPLFSLFVIGLFLFSDLISLFSGFLFQWMSQNSEEEKENHLRLRRIREFIESHQQPKEELIQENQKEQGEMAVANNRTLKELATPNLDQQPLCIQYPNLEVAFELKSP